LSLSVGCPNKDKATMTTDIAIPESQIEKDEATMVATSASPEDGDYKSYKDEEYGFVFRYPKDWQISPPIMGAHLLVQGLPDDGFTPNINVRVLPLPPGEEDILKTSKEQLQQLYSILLRDLQIKDFGTRKLGGKECLFCHYQGTMEEANHLEQLQFIFSHKDKIFIITFSDNQANFVKNRSQFDSIADSFQFD
jgi:hypothetical protein